MSRHPYDPALIEAAAQAAWAAAGNADRPGLPGLKPSGAPAGRGGAEPFGMLLPPPNITGRLHLGHALTLAYEDLMAREARMRGWHTLWLPSYDHASIGAQYMLDAELAAEGSSRAALGRDAYLARMQAYAFEQMAGIRGQLERFGASLDWSRERFTMDLAAQHSTRAAFAILAARGLIERRDTMTTWCPSCGTGLSDLETDIRTEARPLYRIRYSLLDAAGADSGDFIEIATTRPETIFADAAIALHEGHSQAHLAGTNARIPLTDRPIPILIDAIAKADFGTGALKITPAHDPADAECGARHGLSAPEGIDEQGRLTHLAGPYTGLDRKAGRAATLTALTAGGQLGGSSRIESQLPYCAKCGTLAERRRRLGWFARMRPLADALTSRLDSGELTITPARDEATLRRWLEGITDWNLSRQLWWGHRIPAWTCPSGHASFPTAPAFDDPGHCASCGSHELSQDIDTLDTWFSSALWPFAALGWPDQTPDMARFHPNAMLETGRDIIFFWAARMLMLGLELTGELPFGELFLHGILRDEHGRKMAKTSGNGIDPDSLLAEYGADALRWALIGGTAPGNDLRMRPDKLEAARRLTAKLWNAGQACAMLGAASKLPAPDRALLSEAEAGMLTSLDGTITELDRALGERRFHEAANLLRAAFWHQFCDQHLELAKGRLRDEGLDEPSKAATRAALSGAWRTWLGLLHPFLPHLTEALWQPGRAGGPLLAGSRWPTIRTGTRS